MYVLSDKWEDGYLDYYRAAGQVRIQVKAWWSGVRITDVFFVYSADWRLVWNYLGEVGPRAVLRKVISRHNERLRNQKFLAIGLGMVTEADESCAVKKGEKVIFVAPEHPRCAERVVLPCELVTKADQRVVSRVEQKEGLVFVEEDMSDLRYEELAGWSSDSGVSLPAFVRPLLGDALERWRDVNLSRCVILPLKEPTRIQECKHLRKASAKPLRAVLFGLGNYAKTAIIANLPSYINLSCVHEIEPTQIGKTDSLSYDIDSAPVIRNDEKYDIYFIAGYHHTHAGLAVEGIRKGGYVVMEKPLVTTWQQLERLDEAMANYPGRVFACFQKRYNPLWELAFEDLGVKKGEAINYHCMVFEMPLPLLHWYRWPNSHSRVVSNGCHWIDHFLYMNNFVDVTRYDLWKAKNGDVHINIELKNGAVFGMHLTEQGSKRIGVQDHIELRTNNVTVRVDNASRYFAEDGRRVLRKCRINKLSVYKRMYGEICRRILNGEEGEQRDRVRKSCEIMLRLEDIYQSS